MKGDEITSMVQQGLENVGVEHKNGSNKREPIVLEEEEWVAALEGIIERDFFPDLKSLRRNVALLEGGGGSGMETLSVSRTTGGSYGRYEEEGVGSRMTPGTSRGVLETPRTGCRRNVQGSGANPVVAKLTLDQFLARYTSEDNASFREILDRTNAKKREKAALLLQPPNPSARQGVTQAERITDGYGTSGQGRDVLDGWKYKPINLLMYDGSVQDSLPLSKREQRVGSGRAGMNHKATSLHRSNGRSDVIGENVDEDKLYGMEEKRPVRGDGYSVLATPSFDPGQDGTPIMTWGDVDATPQLLEDDNPDFERKRFKINETPRREQLAQQLGGHASTSLRRRAHAMASPAALIAQRSTQRGGGATPISPAAHRLATRISSSRKKKNRSSSGFGSALRDSYASARQGISQKVAWDSPAPSAGPPR